MKFNKSNLVGFLGSSLLVSIILIACATATVTEPSACQSQAVAFAAPAVPAIPSQYQDSSMCSLFLVNVPAESTTVSLDLSDTVSQLNKVADSLNVNVTSLTIDNSQHLLDWTDQLDIFVQSKDGRLSMMKLAHYAKVMPVPSSLEVLVVMSGNDMLKYLSVPLTMTITINGTSVTACQAEALMATGNINSSINLCVSADGTVSKYL